MTIELLTTMFHDVGPRWAMLFAVGVWFWRVTPWLGAQAEKIIDDRIARNKFELADKIVGRPTITGRDSGDYPGKSSIEGIRKAKEIIAQAKAAQDQPDAAHAATDA